MSNELGRLHVISDARDGRDALGVVAAAVAAGAPVVQVRAKDCTDRALYDFAYRVVELCTPAEVTCIVNDRVDVALAVGAAGTHLGAEDLPIAVVRQVAGPGHLIGGTARDPERAAALVAEGADYLGVGPAYRTVTKARLPAPLGPTAIGAVASAVGVPVIAVGGVATQHVPELVATGVHGIAVVSAISDAPDPFEATRTLLRSLAGTR